MQGLGCAEFTVAVRLGVTYIAYSDQIPVFAGEHRAHCATKKRFEASILGAHLDLEAARLQPADIANRCLFHDVEEVLEGRGGLRRSFVFADVLQESGRHVCVRRPVIFLIVGAVVKPHDW